MENRSHALFAGLFVLVLLAAAAMAAIWFGRKDVVYEPYELVSTYPVAGLSVQSQVRYQGMNVGQVQGLSLDQDSPGTIRVLIGVRPGTPITQGTWAEVATQGVTGISNVDLRDDGRDPQRVTTSVADPYDIPVRPGFFQKLQSLGVGMLEDADAVLDDIRVFLSTENAERFSELLKNTQDLTASLNQSVITLEPAIRALPDVMAQIDQTLKSVDGFTSDITKLTKSAQQTVDDLNSPDGPINMATQSLEQLQRSAAQLQSSTFPEINRALENISEASRSFGETVRQFEQAPQSILFGPAPIKPGPGEAGFGGFTKE